MYQIICLTTKNTNIYIYIYLALQVCAQRKHSFLQAGFRQRPTGKLITLKLRLVF